MTIGKNFLEDFTSDDEIIQPPVTPVQEAEKPVEENQVTEEVVEVEKKEEVQQSVDKTETQLEADAKPTDKVEEEIKEEKPFELDDEAIKAYFKEKKGKEINSIDDLFKEPEASKNELEGLSEDALQFIKFNKETGRGFNDFAELSKDYTKLTPLEIAQKKAIDFSDGELSSSEAIEFLEKELNIDLSEDLDKFDLIKLKGYGKDWLNNKIQDQQKYKQPIEKKPQEQGPEMVTLDNGVMIQKEQYQNLLRQKEQYVEGLKKSQDNITTSTFEVVIDENGEEIKMNIPYDFSQKDKHDMLSSAQDTDKFIQDNYSKDGVIDYAKLQKGLFFAKEENLGKVISSAVNKARAEWIAESVKTRTNANFNTNKIPSETQKGRVVPIPGTKQSPVVPFSLEDF